MLHEFVSYALYYIHEVLFQLVQAISSGRSLYDRFLPSEHAGEKHTGRTLELTNTFLYKKRFSKTFGIPP